MSIDAAHAWLLASRNPDGGWGYLPGDESAPEPTLLAIAAGLPADLAWLETADLGWGDLLLPACLSRTDGAEDLIATTVARITAKAGVVVRDAELDFDATIPAWSWFPDTSPWVEPTSYGTLSLRRTGNADHPRAEAGVRMLLDRQCSDGGWNYGNPAILGAELESDLPPTGWAMLALPSSDATTRGLRRLRDALLYPSATTLSLAALASAAHGADASVFLDALAGRQGPDGDFTGRIDRTALALAALGTRQGRPNALMESA